MTYCTLEDIQAVMDEDDVIRYTDDDDAGSVNTHVVDQVIADADALVDAHLATRYTVPLDPVPALVRGLSCDIAVYKITGRRGIAPDDVRKRYDDAVKFLEKLSTGKAVLQGATGAPGGTGADTVTLTSDSRVFTRSTLGGF